MPNSDDVAARGAQLKEHAEAARTRARMLLVQYRDLTRAVVATEERVALTMDRVAAQQPTRARWYRARGEQAREQATLWRRRARQLDQDQDLDGSAP